MQNALRFIRSWLDYRALQSDIPGFSVAISVDDTVVFAEAYGMADIESDISLTTSHLFHMASQTKMLTATAIMLLVENEQISLDAKAVAYISWLSSHPDDRVKDITIRHLLSHGSGLPRDGGDSDYWLLLRSAPKKPELQAFVMQCPLQFDPGASLKYSNIGYALLGEVIEAVTGRTVQRYIRKHILGPLRLSPAYLDYSPTIAKPLSGAYWLPVKGRRPKVGRRQSVGALLPSTGLYATPTVLCGFATALCSGRDDLLSDRSKREMQKVQNSITEGYDAGLEFGLGHEIQMVGERRLFGHTGHVAGHVSATFFDPERRIAVSVAANARGAASTEIARGIFGILDFFWSAGVENQDIRHSAATSFSARLANDMATVEIVDAGARIVAVDPDSWEPFLWFETLEKVDGTTLRVTTEGSAYNLNEEVVYSFKDGVVERVRFGGLSFWPQKNTPE